MQLLLTHTLASRAPSRAAVPDTAVCNTGHRLWFNVVTAQEESPLT